MPTLLDRAGWRNLKRNPWQFALAVGGIALGVAVVLGIDIANSSIERAFAASSELVTGRATHQVLPVTGHLPDSLYISLRTKAGLRKAAPVLEASVRLAALPDESLSLLGVDLFAESPFRPFIASTGSGAIDIEALLLEPGAVVLPYALADRLAASPGDDLALIDGQRVHVVGILPRESLSRDLADGFIVTDIASAQELLEMPGALSRIDLILTADEEHRVRHLLAPSHQLVTSGPRTNAMLQMTRAFRTNLTALGLLAVLVGAFLIYNTMAFLVVRRTSVTGVLRAVGVSRGQVFAATLREALMIGATGTVIGLCGGYVLGTGLGTLALRTVNDLYFRVAAAPGAPGALVLLKASALGIVGTLLAAAAPAWEAASTAPRASLSRAHLERRARRRAARAVWLAGIACTTALLILWLGSRALPLSFAGLFLFAGSAALVTPAATAGLMAGAGRVLAPLGTVARLAPRGVSAGLSRTGVAVSALMLAVATVIGVGLMIGSFRGSVAAWLENVITADFYLSASEPDSRLPVVNDALLARIAELPDVASVGAIRQVWVPVADGRVRLWAIQPGGNDIALGLQTTQSVSSGGLKPEVMVSEPFSLRYRVNSGDSLTLPTAGGPVAFRVSGVFVDYSSDQGVVAMSRQLYRELFSDDVINGLRVTAEPSHRAAVGEHLRRLVSESGGELRLRSSGEIRDISLAIFDRTFTITQVLRLIAGLVAFLGVISALQALALERAREFATLRAIGFTPRQIGSLVMGQTGLLGLAAGILAIPTGIALAALLVFVINRRAFGWTMQFELSSVVMGQGLLLALAAAALAGIYPAIKSARAVPARGLREE